MSSFLSLLRKPCLIKNTLQDTFRKRNALTFRKTLGVYNYKVNQRSYYKNPHAIDLKTMENLKNNGDNGQRKIKAMKNMSLKPFGNFTNKGTFKFDYRKIPLINIPEYANSEV
jgi:large subunit ribosomal protein L41